jgi:hypothetical protein
MTFNVFIQYADGSSASYSFDVSTTTNNPLVQLNLSPQALNTLGYSLITEETDWYSVTDNFGHSITFEVCACKKYPNPVHLVFLNRVGGFESAWFRGKNLKSVDIDRKSFGTNEFTVITNDGDPNYLSYQDANNSYGIAGNSRTYSVNKKYKWHLSTEVLSDEEFSWLGELVASPQIYIEMFFDGSPCYFPVRITNTNYDYKLQMNDKLNPLEIDIELLKQVNTQFA